MHTYVCTCVKKELLRVPEKLCISSILIIQVFKAKRYISNGRFFSSYRCTSLEVYLFSDQKQFNSPATPS